jgi:3-hydroxyacyl-CoA dehydrogenase/enoyl-CoA hydratase/3-hydroxybutyryl-CoA epimerase
LPALSDTQSSRSMIEIIMSDTFTLQLEQVKNGSNRPKGVAASTVKKVGILGAGMMGQGIAYVSAVAGIEVVLKDISLEAAEKGKAYSARVLDKQIARGRMAESEKSRVLDLIQATAEDEALRGCDLIVEAVFENFTLKNKITAATEKYLAVDGIWGSNTSTLPITKLAESSANQNNFIGIHFFSPVDKMALVEIICGKKTSDETLARTFDYVCQINKIPIVVNDSPGFFTSRVFGQQLSEAAQMLAEGIHPERIDAMAESIGMPIGPLAVHDETSQVLSVKVLESQVAMGLIDPSQDTTPAGSELLLKMVNEFGRGGRHHGGGYYDYSESGKQIWPQLIEMYYKPEFEISDVDLKDRLLFRSVIESFKCLQEGVLRSVADGNVGSVMGIGAPPATGGYLQFANSYGLVKFVARCTELAEKYGVRFEPPANVVAKAAAGELFV